MLILAQRDGLLVHHGLVIFYRLVARDVQHLSGEIRRTRNGELADGLVFFAHIHHRLFCFLGFRAHALRDEAQLPAFHCEEVRLLLIGNGGLVELRVFHVFFLHARTYLRDDVEIIPDVLLYLVRVHIEVEHPFGKCIEEVGIVRDDHDGFVVRDEEFREVRDAFLVEIVGRLIEKKQVGALDERRGKQEPRLLSAGE